MNNPWTVSKIEKHLKTILLYGYVLQCYDGNFVICVPGGNEETISEGKTIRACIIDHCSAKKRAWRKSYG